MATGGVQTAVTETDKLNLLRLRSSIIRTTSTSGGCVLALTRDFKEAVLARVQVDRNSAIPRSRRASGSG